MPGFAVRGLLGALVATVVGLLAVLFAAPVALAHDDLVRSVPAAGETVTAVPTEVSLTFSAAIGEQFAQVAVVDDAGTTYQSGPPVVRGDTVTQAVDGLPAQAALSVNYRVVSSDGHPITGSVPFTVDEVVATPDPVVTPSPSPAEATTPRAEPAAQPSEAPTASPVAVDATAATDTTGTAGGGISAALPWLVAAAALTAAAAGAYWWRRRSAPQASGDR
jgi:hypothetical protein